MINSDAIDRFAAKGLIDIKECTEMKTMRAEPFAKTATQKIKRYERRKEQS